MQTIYKRSDFDFDLPSDLIAQFPTQQRSQCLLLNVLDENNFEILKFFNLLNLLKANDLLVFNNSKVIKARFFGEKYTGGKLEILIERIIKNNTAMAHIKSSKSPKINSTIFINVENAENTENSIKKIPILVESRCENDNELFLLKLDANQNQNQDQSWYEIAEKYGKMPLPPYIQRPANSDDEKNYQPIYAKNLGAIAAPTAGLHFDENLLANIAQQNKTFLTLHVGAGTYQPVRTENLSEHKMHSEFFEISAETADKINKTKNAGGRIIAVGTTSLRALESSATDGKISAQRKETDIFITPGYQFKIVDALITNFHLPCSTLLMLVSAFSGMQTIKNAYKFAIENKFRFFSYGDAMFLQLKK